MIRASNNRLRWKLLLMHLRRMLWWRRLRLRDVLIQHGNMPLRGSLLDGRRKRWCHMLLYHLRVGLLLLHRHLLIGALGLGLRGRGDGLRLELLEGRRLLLLLGYWLRRRRRLVSLQRLGRDRLISLIALLNESLLLLLVRLILSLRILHWLMHHCLLRYLLVLLHWMILMYGLLLLR